LSVTHVFAGNPLDRGDVSRRDPQWLEAAAREPSARFLPLWQLNPLIEERGDASRLGWLARADLDRLEVTLPPVFLGIGEGVAHFAIDISEVEDPYHELNLGGRLGFTDARRAAMALPSGESGILAQARAQLAWHRGHRYCSSCGAPTMQEKGGHLRRCGRCGADHFPRTDPVAIMLVVDGGRCLLGQSHGPLARTGMYSALAGFIDQGETIEEAVRREVMEEAGVAVGAVRYHSSQPWPFPSSLMIGCHAQASSSEIAIDPEEMHDVRWFERMDVEVALAGEHPELRLPGPIAIAHHLVRAWVDGEVDFA